MTLIVIISIRLLSKKVPKTACTLFVLGDLGRSPRMQYHALSLAKYGKVNLIGTDGTIPCSEVVNNKNISIQLLAPFPPLPTGIKARKLAFVLYMPLKVTMQTIQSFFLILACAVESRFILVQNPPSIPTLFSACFAAFIARCTFVIDWHNFGYTILRDSLKLPQNNLLIRLALAIEKVFGTKYGDIHFTVTEAMKQFLVDSWNVDPAKVHTLHDQPHDRFRVLKQKEKNEFVNRFASFSEIPPNVSELLDKKASNNPGVFLFVSSTSWTPDEDFSVLLNALRAVDTHLAETNADTHIVMVITGMGPQRNEYLTQISKMRMTNVHICSVWLSHDDYALLLASSDLGISLHQSSSQLDLPMKIYDLYGSGTPCVARGYQCLRNELVIEGKTGWTFDTAEQLTQKIQYLITKDGKKELGNVRNIIIDKNGRWEYEWDRIAAPLLVSEEERTLEKTRKLNEIIEQTETDESGEENFFTDSE